MGDLDRGFSEMNHQGGRARCVFTLSINKKRVVKNEKAFRKRCDSSL